MWCCRSRRAYFQYIANRALLQAQRTTLQEAAPICQAAEERQRVGVATIADVLQARTAASQAELAAETTEGDLQTSRGALALSLGLPANLPYEIDSTAAQPPVALLADSVDVLIARAVQARPDLAAARAEYETSRAQISVARANRLPSLELERNRGRTYTTSLPQGGNNYTRRWGFESRSSPGSPGSTISEQAAALADAARRPGDALGQQVVFQVFSSYYALRTAHRRVRTAEDLMASAQQSNDVALGRYKAGVGSVLDLLRLRAALATARAQQVLARLEWNTSLAQLAHDAGVLDPSGGSPLRLHRTPLPRLLHDDCLFTDSSSSPGLLALAFGLPAQSKIPPRVSRRCRSRWPPPNAARCPFELAATGTVEPLQTVAVQAQVERAARTNRLPGRRRG